MKLLKKSIWLWIGFFAILIAGTYLRVINLDSVSYLSLEISGVSQAHRLYLGEEVRTQNISEQAQIFPQVIQYCFTAFGDSEFAARSFSLFWGILLIILMFFIGWRFAGKGNAGIIAAFVTAFHPLLIDFSRLATIHNAYIFMLTFFFYAIYESIEGTREKHAGLAQSKLKFYKLLALWNIDFFWLAISLLIAWSMYAVFPASTGLYYGLNVFALMLFLLQYFQAKQQSTLKWKYLFLVLILAGVNLSMQQSNTLSVDSSASWSLEQLFTTKAGIELFFLHPSNWTLVAFALIGAIFSLIHMHKAGFYTLTIFVGFYLLAKTSPVSADYIFIFPLFLLLASYGVFEIAYYIRRQLDVQLININQYRRLRITPQRLVMGLFLGIIVVISPWVGEAKNTANRPMMLGYLPVVEWSEVGKYLKQNQKNGEPVVAIEPANVMFYGLPGRYFQFVTDSSDTTSGSGVTNENSGIARVNLAEVQDLIDRFPVGWLVLERSQQNQYLLLRLKDVTQPDVVFAEKFVTPQKTAHIYRWEIRQARVNSDNN